MMTDLLIIAVLAVSCSFIATVFVTVSFRQALRDMSRANNQRDERHDVMMSATLDRFQAIRWEDLAAMRALADTTDEGGFLSPQEQRDEADTQIIPPDRWSPVSRRAAADALDENEQQLLEEDFPDENR